MKKVTVAFLLVGAFILYSFLYHSNAVALLPTSSLANNNSSPGSSSTPGTAGTPGAYKDGTYDGSVDDAVWGNVQVEVVIQNGRMASVRFLQYPHDRNRSIDINSNADPQLCNEAIQAQSANVDVVSGATDTSEAFIQSLTDALAQAQA